VAEEAGRSLEGEGLDRVTVHPGMILGPDDAGPGTSGALLMRLISGTSMPDARGAFVDVRDVGSAIVAALGAPRGAHYLLAEGVHTYRDLGTRIDALTRRPRRTFDIPPRMLRAIARLNDFAGGRLVDLVPAGSLDYILGNARVVDTTRTTRELRIAFRPIDETLVDTIRWWARHGLLDPKRAGALGDVVPGA
jgi:dihydroflavonol-4-reductase